MTPRGKGIVAVLLIGLVAAPTGMCSLFFTPVGVASMFKGDSLERSIGGFALICSGVGWLLCGLSIWGAVRLRRSAAHEVPPTEPAA
jgi:hypothetical protein